MAFQQDAFQPNAFQDGISFADETYWWGWDLSLPRVTKGFPENRSATYAVSPLIGALAEGPTAADAYDATQRIPVSDVEGPVAGDASAALQVQVAGYVDGALAIEQDAVAIKLTGSLIETILGGDAYAAAITFAGSLIETILGGDAYAVTIALTATYVDGATAVEQDASRQVEVAGYVEGPTAGEADDAHTVMGAVYTDGATAGDLYDQAVASAAAAFDDYWWQPLVAAPGPAKLHGEVRSGAYAITAPLSSAIGETIVGGDAYGAHQIESAGYSDGLTLVDLYDAIKPGTGISETILGGDGYAAGIKMGAVYVDGAAAGDAYDYTAPPPAVGEDYWIILPVQVIAGFVVGELADFSDQFVPFQGSQGQIIEGPLAAEDYAAHQVEVAGQVEGPIAAEQEAAQKINPSTSAETIVASDQATAGLIIPAGLTETTTLGEAESGQPSTLGIVETLILADAEASTLVAVARLAEGALLGDLYDVVQSSPNRGDYREGALPGDALDATLLFAGQLAETVILTDQAAMTTRQGAAEGGNLVDVISGAVIGGGRAGEGLAAGAAFDLSVIPFAPPRHGKHHPTAVPTWQPRLMLSIDQAAQRAVIAATGGAEAILQSPAFLAVGAPADPRNPDATRAIWQYEGDFYEAAIQAGIRLLPGALYLAIVSGQVRARLVAPGPVAWLDLPDLKPATVIAAVVAMNALVP